MKGSETTFGENRNKRHKNIKQDKIQHGLTKDASPNPCSLAIKTLVLRTEMHKILSFNKVFDTTPHGKSLLKLKRHWCNLATSHLAVLKLPQRCYCKLKSRTVEEVTHPLSTG